MLSFSKDNTPRLPADKLNSRSFKSPYNSDNPLSLDLDMDYDGVFSVVKKSVRTILGKERSGIGLALSNLPAGLGAYWEVGGNYIVMNELLVEAMKKITKSKREFNSFVYMILMHEYLHSLGFIDEAQARSMTIIVTREIFGDKHEATKMSSTDLWKQYPLLLSLGGGDGSVLKIISKFDSDTTSYIS